SKQKFLASSAQAQKKYIEKVFREPVPQTIVQPPATSEVRVPRIVTSTRYAEILEEGDDQQAAHMPTAPQQKAVAKITAQQQMVKRSSEFVDPSVANLKSEISHLKGMLTQFQNVPQSFMSFHPGAEHGLPYELSAAF